MHGVFEKPTLFVRGGQSDYILEEDFPLIRRLFPVSLIKTIDPAGHWVHADAPKQLCSILREFTGQDCPYQPES
jgi:pimeloyl-ACP methyl ester carboxylesterase